VKHIINIGIVLCFPAFLAALLWLGCLAEHSGICAGVR
jgi:hypothetical protein